VGFPSANHIRFAFVDHSQEPSSMTADFADHADGFRIRAIRGSKFCNPAGQFSLAAVSKAFQYRVYAMVSYPS
jgi:hypothetical protein